MYRVEYYEKEDGKIPCKEFIDSLSLKMKLKAIRSIECLEELGTNIREPYSKYIGDGIFELRIKFSSDITRIFYFFVKDKTIILTNGFIKKTKKTPKKYIEMARKYKKDYEIRIGEVKYE